MMNIEVASRYARAIYSLSKENSEQEVVLKEISTLAKVLEDKDLKAHLDSPVVSYNDKKDIVKKLLSTADFKKTTESFLSLLADKSRLSLLPEISFLLQKFSDETAGVVRGDVVSASDLSNEDKSSIETKISSLLNKKLLLEYKVDPSLLGGVVVKVGDYTIDYSVNRQLDRIKESLNEGVQ